MSDADHEPGTLPADDLDDSTDPKEGIRDRSVREVVERTRDVIRKTRELLDNSRELLDRVRHRNEGGAAADEAPGEQDADEASEDNAGADARPVDGRG